MKLPQREFYTLHEVAARWGCALADISGWSTGGQLDVITGIPPKADLTWRKKIVTAFEKTLDLMRLAEMAAARHKGVCLVEVSAEFGVNLRTAQRMIRGLEAALPA